MKKAKTHKIKGRNLKGIELSRYYAMVDFADVSDIKRYWFFGTVYYFTYK